MIGSIGSNLSEQSSGIVSDNKSYLSYSRTSLASTAPSFTKEEREKRKVSNNNYKLFLKLLKIEINDCFF
uniref:Uncharacterized protein n=1 Tax=Heterorhabditis bacteriophora TaxID=37862 RepID=A0A1I7WGI9_HETBA